MKKKDRIIISILIVIIIAISLAIVSTVFLNNPVEINQNQSGEPCRELIANNSSDPGSVEVIKNLGNSNSTHRIAYVVGLHPLEHETHETLVKLLPGTANLNYSYDIYIINVTEDVGHYGDGSSDNSPGRQNGQDLAYKYVYPAILKGNYSLAVDVHSNVGAYPYQTFVFSPVNEGLGEKLAGDVAGNASDISYYSPDSTTSGPYLTIPLNQKGIPAFYFEEYSFASQDVKDAHMMQLINAVDNLRFN